MRKLVRTPPTSTACIDSRGKPSTRMPTSVEVPPTSMTRASLRPARALAPRIELVGPDASVNTGYLTAWADGHERAVVLRQVGVDLAGRSRPGPWPGRPRRLATRPAATRSGPPRPRARAGPASRSRGSRSRPPNPRAPRPVISAVRSSWLYGGGTEGAGDGDGPDLPGTLAREAPHGVLIERRDLAAVVLEAAMDDGRRSEDGLEQLWRPGSARPDRVRRGGSHAQDADAVQTGPLDDGVGRMGRAQHHLRDRRPCQPAR